MTTLPTLCITGKLDDGHAEDLFIRWCIPSVQVIFVLFLQVAQKTINSQTFKVRTNIQQKDDITASH